MNKEFETVVATLTKLKMPCRVKLTNEGEVIIELGFRYPDELAERIFGALPDFKGTVCADSHGYNIVASKSLNGGPKTYW